VSTRRSPSLVKHLELRERLYGRVRRGHEATRGEIGELFGISPQRVEQIERRAMARIGRELGPAWRQLWPAWRDRDAA
jgi:DNA-directed RNA polymerase specialized sigma subunit